MFLLEALLDRGKQHLLFLVGRAVEELRVARLGAHAEMDEERCVAAVIEDQVGRAPVAPFEDAVRVVPVVLERLALDSKDRRAAGGHRGGGVVLGRIDVAGGPAHFGTERPQCLDEHRGLDRHMQ